MKFAWNQSHCNRVMHDGLYYIGALFGLGELAKFIVNASQARNCAQQWIAFGRAHLLSARLINTSCNLGFGAKWELPSFTKSTMAFCSAL